MNKLLELINECSSMREYKANTEMPESIVYDYLNLNKSNYVLLKNGKKMVEGESLLEDDHLLVFYSFIKKKDNY